MKISLSLLCLLLWASASLAKPATIGPELAFTNAETAAAWNARYNANVPDYQTPTATGELVQAQRLGTEIIKNCAGCRVRRYKGKFGLETSHIDFPNGFWVEISVDPGIVELQTPPLTPERYVELTPFIEETIYGAASRLNMSYVPTDGHLNFGVRATFETVKGLAAFMLDQINHPELGLGVLGQDIENGPPLAIEELDQLKKFFAVMDDVKSGKVFTLTDFASRINEGVYYRSMELLTATAGAHYQGVSIKRLNNYLFPTYDQPLEIRWAAGQPTFRRVMLMYEFYLKRIEYLQRTPEFANLQRRLYAKPLQMTAPEKLTRFYIYVQEMGADFDVYKELIDSKRIASAKLDPIVTNEFDWTKRDAFARLVRYLPDVETSEWVQKRFQEIVADPNLPPDIKTRIQAAFKAQMQRPDINPANFKSLLKYQSAILPPELRIVDVVGPIEAPCDQIHARIELQPQE